MNANTITHFIGTAKQLAGLIAVIAVLSVPILVGYHYWPWRERDRQIEAQLMELAQTSPMMRILIDEDPSFMSGAKDIIRRGMDSGDARRMGDVLYAFTNSHTQTVVPIIQRASDETLAEYGAQQFRLLDRLSRDQPQVCAELLLGHPSSFDLVTKDVLALFNDVSSVMAKAYREGKAAISVAPAGNGEALFEQAVDDVQMLLTDAEAEAFADPENADSEKLCTAYAKLYKLISTDGRPKAETANMWRYLLDVLTSV
jgi:hypothetical protein